MDANDMREVVTKQLAYAVDSVNIPELKGKDKFYRGKVRESYMLGDKRLIITTDMLSAFDHVLRPVPYKGAVLNGIATFSMNAAADTFPNALLETIGTVAMIQENLGVLPIEAIVRAYITGSAARDYFDKGQKTKSGIDLSKYLKEGKRNERFTELLFTPSTKATTGHDEDISEEQIIESELLTREQLDCIKRGSFCVFRVGEKLASERDLILVDTKFEYGIDKNGKIKLVDEVLTPDSSRYWIAASYQDLYAQNKQPEELSKEFTRKELIGRVAEMLGVDSKAIEKSLDKIPKEMWVSVFDDELRIGTSLKYLQLYKQFTGKELELTVGDPRKQMYNDLKAKGLIKGYFVPIIAGSPGDDEHVKKIKDDLQKRGIPCEHRICSAHKGPVRLVKEVMADYEDSIEPVVYVTVAGMSNGLSGVVAANSRHPVIACPPYSEKYGGSDIYSTIRMPSGTPVMTVLEPSNVGAAAQRMFGLFDAESQKRSVIEIQSNRTKGSKADEERKN